MDITITITPEHVSAIQARIATGPLAPSFDANTPAKKQWETAEDYIAWIVQNDAHNISSFLPEVQSLQKQAEAARDAGVQKLKDGVKAKKDKV